MNPFLLADGYKVGHPRQMPKGMTRLYSNWTPRTSRTADQSGVVFFGLQYFLLKYMGEEMSKNFFAKPRSVVCDEYKAFVDGYLGPNNVGSDHIRDLHKLGYIPLEFRALPEGTLCPLRVPCFTVENTHDDFAWLTNYPETILSNTMWMPCTSATTARRIRKMLDQAAKDTGGDLGFVPWQGHDFSMRGMAGLEAAQLSGAGHLLSFTGTDTIPAIPFLQKYYNGQGLIGGSVPATEHSVMCAGGNETELETFTRLLDLYPTGIVSVVSDTWDLWHVLTVILPKLKDKIMARDGKLVIRPDSGDPEDIICGELRARVEEPRYKGVVELLWDVFGGTRTSEGFRQLDPHIGVIYGDAINYDRAKGICQRLANKAFAATNVVFGIGSYNYQYVTRDTYGFAMKATWAKIDGVGVDLYKAPVTDNGVKNSARGRLAVFNDGTGLKCIEQATPEQEANSLLELVWRDGVFCKPFQTLEEIRERVARS